MLFLYVFFGWWLLLVNNLIVFWEIIVLLVLIYVGLFLVLGIYSCYWILKYKGKVWFEGWFINYLSFVFIGVLLIILVLLFVFKGELIVENLFYILLIVVLFFV